MAYSITRCADIVIPNGTADSNVIKAREVYDDAILLMLVGPTVLDAHTYVIQVCDDPDAAVPVWSNWNNGTSDIAPPAASKATTYPGLAGRGFRIHDSTGNVAADRTWNLYKQHNPY